MFCKEIGTVIIHIIVVCMKGILLYCGEHGRHLMVLYGNSDKNILQYVEKLKSHKTSRNPFLHF